MTQIRRSKLVFICVICVPLLVSVQARGNTVSTANFREEVNTFLGKELAAHLGAIKSLDPPPDRILGVPTTGEFSWGTFMRSLAAYADTTGNRELAGRDIAKWVGQIGLIESRAGSKAFSQLYAALALRHFGRDLKTNPLWQGLSQEEQKAWRSLLNPERFYDPKTEQGYQPRRELSRCRCAHRGHRIRAWDFERPRVSRSSARSRRSSVR